MCHAKRCAFEGDRTNQPHRQETGRYDQEIGPLWRQNPDRELDLPYYGFEHVDLASGHGDQVDGHYNRWVSEQGANLEELRGPENAICDGQCPLFKAWRTRVPKELYPTRYIQNMTEQVLAKHACADGEPFFHWASFCDPHHPFSPPGRYWDMYSPDDVTLPDSASHRSSEGWAARLRELRQSGRADLAGTAAIAATETELRWATALTFGLISMVDDAVGAILDALQRNGQADNTIVIFLADHGELLGDHGLIFKGPYHYQSVTRVPLIWHDHRRRQSEVSETLVSSVDVSASILDAANVKGYGGMNGRSILSTSDGPNRDAILIEDEIQAELPCTNIRGRARSLVTDEWRLTVYDNLEQGELFNLTEDPTESTNRWQDPSAAGKRAELMEALAREMLAHSETGALPEFAA
ncbi:MAG: sulfatase-like hydrolase/transferase [Pseudomonadota bacterium]